MDTLQMLFVFLLGYIFPRFFIPFKKKETPIDKVRKNLATDRGYYNAWKDNIACCFQDEIRRSGYRKDAFGNVNDYIVYESEVYRKSNRAAEAFLKLLID